MKKDVKIKAEFEYDSMEFTVVGLVNKKALENSEIDTVGYIEDGDMMTDAEGFNIHTVLEGQEDYDAYCRVSNGSCGNSTYEIITEGKYQHTIQIGFDIAIPRGLDSGDVEKFMENEVTTFIEKKTKFLVLNGMFSAEDMSHSYDIDEINEMYDKPKTK